jgi:4-diphosphocytidyl-2-C-methyl-D-erythritol kinase
MEEITVKSISKINIGLNIVSKREDGYHNLETIFYPIQLHDVIKFRKSNKINFSSNSTLLNSEKDNLILKAINILEKLTNKKLNVEIHLDKKIPIGAGLGGGSSNAAFTLKTINELFELNISNKELRKLALTLGSDVPLFLFDLPAYAESRGEKLEKLNFKIRDYILIVNPNIHISTKWAFSKISPKPSKNNLKEILERYPNDYKIWKETITNDFEEVVLSEYNQLKDLKNTLIEIGSKFCIMTGSGSTFIGIFDNDERLNEAISFAKEKNYFFYTENPN